MDQAILRVVGYFDRFSYPPSITEVGLFVAKKTSSKELEARVDVLVKTGRLYRSADRVAIRQDIFKGYFLRRKRSFYYFKKVTQYFSWLRLVPYMQYLGISGSLSMLNMTKQGDIDIFVITESQSVWTSRFILLLYKYALKAVSPDIGEKLCFNLFFAENGLKIAKHKQNEYIGHEILQLKPVINKNDIYSRFIGVNSWIMDFFPNVQKSGENHKMSEKRTKHRVFRNRLENYLKQVQTWWLARKKISWSQKNGQLWLIQEDFEKNMY